MRLDWDAAKARANARKHGVTFVEASTAFDDPLGAYYPDALYPTRFVLVGASSKARVFYVVYAEVTLDHIRIISARKATSHERARYETD